MRLGLDYALPQRREGRGAAEGISCRRSAASMQERNKCDPLRPGWGGHAVARDRTGSRRKTILALAVAGLLACDRTANPLPPVFVRETGSRPTWYRRGATCAVRAEAKVAQSLRPRYHGVIFGAPSRLYRRSYYGCMRAEGGYVEEPSEPGGIEAEPLKCVSEAGVLRCGVSCVASV